MLVLQLNDHNQARITTPSGEVILVRFCGIDRHGKPRIGFEAPRSTVVTREPRTKPAKAE